MFYVTAKGRYGAQVYTMETEKGAREAAETLARIGAETVTVQHNNAIIAIYKGRG